MTMGPIAAETTIIFPPREVQIQSRAAPVLAEAGVTFSAADWPFLTLINPDDYPPSTRFIFEAIMDTSDAGFPVWARLVNVTDNIPVWASMVTSPSLHLAATGTRVRSGTFTLASGAKLYRAERGGQAGAGATVHLHLARLLVREM